MVEMYDEKTSGPHVASNQASREDFPVTTSLDFAEKKS
jgi:hypothetical protein